ncbi:MAG TPA: SURF1 family protein [Dermatophilaceae bacterium]|nr:SURF1 family protein [Dermatophilaceae bacterium]
MLRRLFTRRWLGALAVTVVFAVVSFYLGQWQWGRYEAKAARNDRLDAHYAADPVPLGTVLTSSPLPRSRDWTSVEAVGTYRPQDQLYVRNRPNAGVYGYEVLVPLDLTGGTGTVLVNRGWVVNSGRGADVLPPVPAAPPGEVTVTGWVRPGEASLGRDLPDGQLPSMNLAEASAAIGTPVLGGYVLLESERTADGGTAARPTALEPPDRSLGPHQAYAFQWWLAAMPAGFVLIWLGIRRELREEGAIRPKAKKHRIWDDEDE